MFVIYNLIYLNKIYVTLSHNGTDAVSNVLYCWQVSLQFETLVLGIKVELLGFKSMTFATKIPNK